MNTENNNDLFDTEEKSVQSERKPIKKGRSFVGFTIFCCVLILIFIGVLLLNTFVFIRVQVDGPSMENTLYSGDIIVANRLKKADYGDIAIIDGEKKNGDWLVKRVIAKGGDQIRFEEGKVYLKKSGEENFIELKEDYIKTPESTYVFIGGDIITATVTKTVPEGEIFYMGDNRENSSDSRFENAEGEFSFCKEDQILGVVEEWSLYLRGLNKYLGKIFSVKTS